MLKLQLYIKNDEVASTFQQIELFKDESVELTQAIQDIRDIKKYLLILQKHLVYLHLKIITKYFNIFTTIIY